MGKLNLILLLVVLVVPAWSVLQMKKTLSKAPASIESRIIGGALVTPGNYSWTVAIYVTTANGNYFCGGALFNQEWVITAGLCADGAELFTILMGSTKLTGDLNVIKVATEAYVLHPNYNPQTLDHNVALIRLRIPITYNMYLSNINLPFGPLFTDDSVFATGWGQISDTDASLVNDLHVVRLTTLSNEECKIYYGSQVTDTMICAIGNYNEGSCVGDTGGPISQQVRMGYNVVVGIASFISSEGCESTHPSGYTRTFGYLEWFSNVTGFDQNHI